MAQTPSGNSQRGANAGLEALSIVGWVGVAAGILFWGLFLQIVIAPEGVVEKLFAALLASAFGLAHPATLNAVIPSTRMGMMLQQTRWRTYGFWLAVLIAGALSVAGLLVMVSYYNGKEFAYANDLAIPLAILTMIIVGVIPALALAQVTPEQWAYEIKAAQRVNELELAQKTRELAFRTAHLRTATLLRRQLSDGVDALTGDEFKELQKNLRNFALLEAEAFDQVVYLMDHIAGTDTGVPYIAGEAADIFDRVYDGIVAIHPKQKGE
jgi:hypothetical protein